MKSRIHYPKPSITERDVAYANDVARNGWGERCYGTETLTATEEEKK
jgi:perosamine synthetase